MKALILILLVILLSGCAFTKTTITLPEDDQVFSMKTLTLFKDVKDVSGKTTKDGFKFNLGSSESTLTPEQGAAMRCLQNPVLCSL